MTLFSKKNFSCSVVQTFNVQNLPKPSWCEARVWDESRKRKNGREVTKHAWPRQVNFERSHSPPPIKSIQRWLKLQFSWWVRSWTRLFFQVLLTFLLWLDTAPERQSGRKAQISNITAAKVIYWPIIIEISITYKKEKTVADVIRTCLGPKAMLKMILDPMGGIL
jgi:hypothetical protein